MTGFISNIFDGFLEKHDRALEKKIRRQLEVSLTHELKTPLTCILAYSEMLMENISAGPDREYALLINKKSRELLRLIENIINISILELNPQIVYMTVINITDLVKDSISEFKKEYNAKEYSITADLDEAVAIYGNEKMFKKMITEILVNSYLYSRDNEISSIDIKVKKNESDIRINIKDNGIGIDEKHLNRVFDKFFRVGEIETAKNPGLGIGLPLVKKIVELFKGNITVDSNVNMGTMVNMIFPAGNLSRKRLIPG
jgi:two-component system phosphate regulon sensor histidine kinase PhoR